MCTGCMSTADFIVTGGILSAASLRVGARRLLSSPGRWAAKVTDEEAADFMASLDPSAPTEVADHDGDAVDHAVRWPEAEPVPEPA